MPKKRGKSTNKVVIKRRCSVCKKVGHTKLRCPHIAHILEEHTTLGSQHGAHKPSDGLMYDNRFGIVSIFVCIVVSVQTQQLNYQINNLKRSVLLHVWVSSNVVQSSWNSLTGGNESIFDNVSSWSSLFLTVTALISG